MSDFEKQLQDYRLTLAQIHYQLPDHPLLLQTFIWQDYDLAPCYPTLAKFLGFWVEKIEGKLHSVYVAHHRLITPAEIRNINGEFLIH